MQHNIQDTLGVKTHNLGRWILSNLTVSLGPYNKYICKFRKHGTLIYRANTDILTAPSNALSMLRNEDHNVHSKAEMNSEVKQDVLYKVLDD